jgi:hypothetical protein
MTLFHQITKATLPGGSFVNNGEPFTKETILYIAKGILKVAFS